MRGVTLLAIMTIAGCWWAAYPSESQAQEIRVDGFFTPAEVPAEPTDPTTDPETQACESGSCVRSGPARQLRQSRHVGLSIRRGPIRRLLDRIFLRCH